KVYENYTDLEKLPEGIIDRLQHYFLTYKQLPSEKAKCEIAFSYGREEAYEVIKAAMQDYQDLLAMLK
ncbi:MAG TPA: inorganic diphosphatase, partial [Pyrinomonadaceae bacterium]|nr:inorganic diphosphatase [Pyrinomonadaceae bacterium]